MDYLNEDFRPRLLQILEKRAHNVDEGLDKARQALLSGSDPLDRSRLPRPVAEYLDRLFSWHYMGAAEYEWFAIPRAVQRLIEARHGLKLAVFVIPGSKLPVNERYQDEPIAPTPPPDLTLYYLGPAGYDIPKLLKLMCKDRLNCKSPHALRHMVDPISSFDGDIIGWLCLDFPFFLVKDRAIFDSLSRLFFGELTQPPET
jgi:hypothetical protein